MDIRFGDRKTRIFSLFAVVVLVVVLVLSTIGSANTEPEPAPLKPVVNCSSSQIGKIIKVTCNVDGVVILSESVKIPNITLPPLPPVTVSGPTVTVTAPGDTQTVRVPGPTITVPSDTQTITTPGEPTVGPSQLPPPETITVSPSGQVGTTSGIVVPIPESPSGSTGDGASTIFRNLPTSVKVLGISTLALLLLVGLLLLGMWFGYIMGYKDSDRENAKFMQALSDKMLIRGRHS